jgi:hypothetical protein
MKTSKVSPLRSLASASFMVLNVVSWTLHLYFLAKLSRPDWFTYATQL